LSYIIPHPIDLGSRTNPTYCQPIFGEEEKQYHGTSTNRRWSSEDGGQPSGGSSTASSAAVELSSPSYMASSGTAMESLSNTGSMAPPRITPRTEGPASGCLVYRGGEFVTPSDGYIFGAREDSTLTLRPMAFDFCNTSDPSPSHHFSTLEFVLPAPGLSQTVPHMLETIDGEDMDTPSKNTIYTHLWSTLNLTKI
jgi:hypothetical protein